MPPSSAVITPVMFAPVAVNTPSSVIDDLSDCQTILEAFSRMVSALCSISEATSEATSSESSLFVTRSKILSAFCLIKVDIDDSAFLARVTSDVIASFVTFNAALTSSPVAYFPLTSRRMLVRVCSIFESNSSLISLLFFSIIKACAGVNGAEAA